MLPEAEGPVEETDVVEVPDKPARGRVGRGGQSEIPAVVGLNLHGSPETVGRAKRLPIHEHLQLNAIGGIGVIGQGQIVPHVVGDSGTENGTLRSTERGQVQLDGRALGAEFQGRSIAAVEGDHDIGNLVTGPGKALLVALEPEGQAEAVIIPVGRGWSQVGVVAGLLKNKGSAELGIGRPRRHSLQLAGLVVYTVEDSRPAGIVQPPPVHEVVLGLYGRDHLHLHGGG